MDEMSFRFDSDWQRNLYERFISEIRALDWESIRRAVEDYGEYQLGLTRDLRPSGNKDPSQLTAQERQRDNAWLFAMLQVTLQEQHLSWGHGTDPQTRADAIVISAHSQPLPEAFVGVIPEDDEDEADEGPEEEYQREIDALDWQELLTLARSPGGCHLGPSSCFTPSRKPLPAPGQELSADPDGRDEAWWEVFQATAVDYSYAAVLRPNAAGGSDIWLEQPARGTD